MNVFELEMKLKELHIPEEYYSLMIGGLPNERLCLVCEENVWKVYYSERGEKNGLKIFETEADACAYFYKKMSKYAK